MNAGRFSARLQRLNMNDEFPLGAWIGFGFQIDAQATILGFGWGRARGPGSPWRVQTLIEARYTFFLPVKTVYFQPVMQGGSSVPYVRGQVTKIEISGRGRRSGAKGRASKKF